MTNGWYQLDNKALTELIGTLYGKYSLDCTGIESKFKKNRLDELLRVRMNVSENESIRLQVIGAGRDGRMGSADDRTWESAEMSLIGHNGGQPLVER